MSLRMLGEIESDRVVAVRPVRQGRRRLRRLQGPLTIAGSHLDGVMSGGDARGELPEAPRVGGELGLQVGGLPGSATIPAELDAADPPGTLKPAAPGFNATRS